MSSESPAVILYSSDGYELAAINGNAIPTNTRGLLVEGSDGTNSRFMAVDSSGRPIVVGAGTAGTPVGGVLTIQGIAGGTTVPVSGTVTATNGSVSNTGAAPPAQATYVGASVTTAAPTYTTGQMDPLSLTTAGLLRIDGVYPINTATPTSDAVFMAAAVTTAAPTYTTGQLSALSLTTTGQLRIDGVFPLATTTPTTDANYVAGAVTTAAPTYTNGQLNGISLDTSGNLRVLANQPTAANLNATIVGSGSAGTPATGVVTIQGIAGGTAIPVSGSLTVDKSVTGTLTSVPASISSVSILASNASRVGAAIYNDGGSILFLALSASAASPTAFTIRIMPNSYYDLPVTYTGAINGVWNGNSGNARVTEFT